MPYIWEKSTPYRVSADENLLQQRLEMQPDEELMLQSSLQDLSHYCTAQELQPSRTTRALHLLPSFLKPLLVKNSVAELKFNKNLLLEEKRKIFPGTSSESCLRVFCVGAFTLFVLCLICWQGKFHLSQVTRSKDSDQISLWNVSELSEYGRAYSSSIHPLYRRAVRSTSITKGKQKNNLLTSYQNMETMKEIILPCDSLLKITNYVLRKVSEKAVLLETCDQKLSSQIIQVDPLILLKVKIKPQLLQQVLMLLKRLGMLIDAHQGEAFSIMKKLMAKEQKRILEKTVKIHNNHGDGEIWFTSRQEDNLGGAGCPDKVPHLFSWNPGHNEKKKVKIGRGVFLRLESSASMHSIIIENGGKLVFADAPKPPITLRAKYILIRNGGELHIGSEGCPYSSIAVISLYGKSTEVWNVENFGKKFIGVDKGGVLELHGRKSMSWTFLAKTLYPGGMQHGAYRFEKQWGTRGINVRIIDQGTGQVLVTERFDTHLWVNESKRLQQFLLRQAYGRIVAMAVGDSAARRLTSQVRETISELLGSNHVKSLSYRQPWALVGVIGVHTLFVVEDKRFYQPDGSTGMALARRNFQTHDGIQFTVTAFSEWLKGVPHCGFRVEVSNGVILNLMDKASSWLPGSRIVIASTDYSMYQAEEFNLIPCPECNIYQVKIDGIPQYLHMGEVIDGIDMRAEVGLLNRKIIIKGEMEDVCYGENHCHFFNYDTFGGQIRILNNFASVHLSGVEVTNMGQQILGSYPVHFHLAGDVDQRGGYHPPTYVDNLAIHHCFSRCVAIHGTNGLLVKDTIGYDTLGHCFFLEDGVEERNTLYHNLGLLTKAGTILPSDRNEIMCVTIRDQVYGSYIPVPSSDCMAVTTFWIANPNNNLINNAAAGAQDVGIWYIFHRVPTGDSVGQYPEGQTEFTPLGIFYNNRVHSNFKAGLFIGNGVKTTKSNADNPREVLTVDIARFRPHQDADPRKPRVPANIDGLVAFKNNDHGAWARGGDIIFSNSGFSDNGIGLTLASDGTFPTDEGSSLEVSKSIFVGESSNVGFNGGKNRYWGKGARGEYRTLPRNRTFPIRGFQIYDGPVRLRQCTFKKYQSTHERYSSALAFFMRNSWQVSPQNNVSQLMMERSVDLKVFFGKAGQWFGAIDLDGDKASIFHDLDGSVTGFPDTFVARADNYLIRHPGCLSVPRWNGVICGGKYAQLYVQARHPENLSLQITRDPYPNHVLTLQGVNRKAPYQQYQAVVMLQQAYTLCWNGRAPKEIVLYPINFNRGDWIQVGLCYPRGTVFKIMSDINERQTGRVHSVERYKAASSFSTLQKNPDKSLYYFDSDMGLLFIILQAKHIRKGHSYCSKYGCERVKISAHMMFWEVNDYLQKIYPVKYPSMPSYLLSLTQRTTIPCDQCGAPQVAITSDPHRKYVRIQIQSQSGAEIQNGQRFAFIKVNDEVFLFEKPGLFFVVMDACSGDIVSRQHFDMVLAPQVADVIANYIKITIPDRSIVLVCSRDDASWQLTSRSAAFLRLGAAQPMGLFVKGSFAMLGFKGQMKPAWIKIVNRSAGQKMLEVGWIDLQNNPLVIRHAQLYLISSEYQVQ
uniref:hyaluronoglucosaminidase n=1 Tax=Callorhinchus milii TaxID=7868 RepID=A0A4W3GVJ4_CALMI